MRSKEPLARRLHPRWRSTLPSRHRSFGFFFPVDEDDPAGSSGEVLILEVTDLDEEGQPCEFELLDDEEIAAQIYDEFREATKDLYDFE